MKTKSIVFIGLILIAGYFIYPANPISCPPTVLKHINRESGNAGCLIQKDGKVLVIRQTKTGKLNFPGGTAEKNENAACTAYRETMEETGQKILVKDLFHHYTNPDFYLFKCELLKETNSFEVPSNFKHEVKEAFFVDIETIEKDQWRFPNEMEMLKEKLKNTT